MQVIPIAAGIICSNLPSEGSIGTVFIKTVQANSLVIRIINHCWNKISAITHPLGYPGIIKLHTKAIYGISSKSKKGSVGYGYRLSTGIVFTGTIQEYICCISISIINDSDMVPATSLTETAHIGATAKKGIIFLKLQGHIAASISH